MNSGVENYILDTLDKFNYFVDDQEDINEMMETAQNTYLRLSVIYRLILNSTLKIRVPKTFRDQQKLMAYTGEQFPIITRKE